MSAVWLVPILVGVVAVCVLGVLDSFIHLTNRRVREEAEALASLADAAESLGSVGAEVEGHRGSRTRPDRH